LLIAGLAAGCGEAIDDPMLEPGDTGDTDAWQVADAGLDVFDSGPDIFDSGSDTFDSGPDTSDSGSDAGGELDSGDAGVDTAVYTVEHAMLETCTTESVVGLSFQLIDEMNCLDPGTMSSFAGADDVSYSTVVFPFLQAPATQGLVAVASDNAGEISLNSALRTIAQQYLLYQWYTIDHRQQACHANLAARPGDSNHNGGLAVDIDEPEAWQEALWQEMFFDDIASEPWHFDYRGEDARDVRSLSVRAFQRLWNRNRPDDPITVDGLYGPETEGALNKSPAVGFASPPSCPTVMSLQGFPFEVPIRLRSQPMGPRSVRLETLAPSGVTRVEYRVAGQRLASVSRADAPNFRYDAAVPPAGTAMDVEATAYDRNDQPRGHTQGQIRRPTLRSAH
jgi:hypothetical protein